MAYCGLDCQECPVFIATRDDDDAARQRVADEWTAIVMQHWAKEPLKASDMNCQGCRSEALFAGCHRCPIRACCRDKGLEHCGLCEALGSCGRIAGLLQEFPQALTNLQQAGQAAQERTPPT